MKRIYFIILILIISNISLKSQGFNWEYSSSMPSRYPDFYLGLIASGQTNRNMGNFTFTESYVPCCEFTSGSGVGLNFGLTFEKWYSGSWAAGVNAAYSIYSDKFSTKNTYPRVDYNVTYQLDYTSLFSYINLELRYKKRIGRSHFNLSAALKTDVLIAQSNSYTESIVSPEDETYIDGSKKRTIVAGTIAPLWYLVLIPKLGAGYDINLGKSKFANLTAYAELPSTSLVREGSWRRWAIGVDFLLYYGIFL